MLRRSLHVLVLAVGLVISMGCSTEGDSEVIGKVPPPLVDSTWLADDISGAGIVGGAQASLAFHPDGRVAGSGGCNRYSGIVFGDGDDALSFHDLGSTLKACDVLIDDQERRFFDALNATRSYRFQDPGHHLVLIGANGSPLMRLSQQAP
ncbi:MAG: META domain-containing protein [Defluviicoccus sp.]|nr:MAG: META domain-containing protein [Defluviicoccus sp.]